MGTTAVIKSPNYPQDYPKNLNCTWTISAVRDDQRVRVVFQSLSIDSRGDNLILYDGKYADKTCKMHGPLDMIYLADGKAIEPAGTKRPYFSSHKYMTVQLTTDDTYQSKGFQLSTTAVKRGSDFEYPLFKNSHFKSSHSILGHTCTYEYPYVKIHLSDKDTHFPHTSRYSYIESPNFGGNGQYFSDIK